MKNFDSQGKYISKINDKGDGPLEYIRITSFEVNRVNKRVIFADSFSCRIFVYDENGNQHNVIQLDFNPIIFLPYEDGFLHVYSGPRNEYDNPEMENYNLHFLDPQGKFISSAIEVTTPNRIDISSHYMVDCLDNGHILFQPVLSEIINKIGDDKKITPLYGFVNKTSKLKFLNQKEKENFEYIMKIGDKTPLPQVKESEDFLISWGVVRDLKDCVFFTFGFYKKYYLYYSKLSNKSLFINPKNTKADGNLVHILLGLPRTTNNNKFYISIEPWFIYEIRDQLPKGIIKTFFENTPADSNPVLVSFSIKFPE